MKTKPETKKQTKTEAKKPEQTINKTPTDAEPLSASAFLEDLFKVFIGGDHSPATPERKPVDDQVKALSKDISAIFSADGSPVKIKIGDGQPKSLSEIEDLKLEPDSEDLMDEDSPYSRITEALQKKAKALTPFDSLYDMVSSDVEILNDTQIPEFERILVHLNGMLQYDLHDAVYNYGEALRSLRRAAEKLLAALDVDKESREADEADMKEEE